MEAAIVMIFLVLMISAPWISRRWGPKGELLWGMIAMAFLTTVILVLT